MSEPVVNGEAVQPIVNANAEQQTTEAVKPTEAAPDFSKMIADALAENDKKWQSRFDKVLTEKKQVESKTLTVEERMAQLESERAAERLAWTRKEHKLSAGFDDEMHAAMLDYASADPDKIADGAAKIKAMLDAKDKSYGAKIAELEAKIKWGDTAPPAGSSSANSITREAFDKMDAKSRAAFMAKPGATIRD